MKKIFKVFIIFSVSSFVDLYEDYKILKCNYYFYAMLNDVIRKGKCIYKKLENKHNLLIQSVISPYSISLRCINNHLYFLLLHFVDISNESTADFISSFLKAIPYIVKIQYLDLSCIYIIC